MKKLDAQKALKQGKVITHQLFKEGENIRLNSDSNIEFDNGTSINHDVFWNDRQDAQFNEGWSLVK